MLFHKVSMTQAGEQWDQAQPALWAWPSLAEDPGFQELSVLELSHWWCWG